MCQHRKCFVFSKWWFIYLGFTSINFVEVLFQIVCYFHSITFNLAYVMLTYCSCMLKWWSHIIWWSLLSLHPVINRHKTMWIIRVINKFIILILECKISYCLQICNINASIVINNVFLLFSYSRSARSSFRSSWWRCPRCQYHTVNEYIMSKWGAGPYTGS